VPSDEADASQSESQLGRRGPRNASSALPTEDGLAVASGDQERVSDSARAGKQDVTMIRTYATRAELEARMPVILTLSRAVFTSADTGNALDRIAGEADAIAGADAAGILELTGQGHFRIVGSHNLSPEYRRSMHDWPTPVEIGSGPSGLAVARGEAVISADFRQDFPEWAAMPWGAIAAFPLSVESDPLGTLVVYRRTSGEWNKDAIRLLEFVAEHAAVAIHTAKLIAEQKRQVASLERLVAGLREQAHEHANRLHAIAGLLILKEPEEALALLQDLTSLHLADRVTLGNGWPHSALTAMLHVEMLLARHRAIALEVQQPNSLSATLLTDAQAVTIVGNLLDNARDAVGEMPPERRKILVKLSEDTSHMTLTVRDWGTGLPEGVDCFERGVTSRADHAGLGLAIVREAVISAYGEISAERHDDGATFVVRVPLAAA
jgi:signal transduction histidine kinase